MTGTAPIDILLIQPPIRDFYLTAKRTFPAGLSSIAAALRAEGFAVGLFDALARGKSRPLALPADWNDLAAIYGPDDRSPFGLFNRYRHFGYSLRSVAAAARRSGAFLIGISSLFSPYEDMALATAEIVKSVCPGTFIVLGGHHPTAMPERLLAHPAVDGVLRGDGEASLPALAQALVQRRPLDTVPGIGFQRSDGSCHLAPPAFTKDLNRLRPPALDLVDTAFYARGRKSSILITASRGCPLTCSYCCTGQASTIPYRRRSVNHVVREIRHADQQLPIGFIDFEDENISLARGWFLALLAAIRRHFGTPPPELRAMNGLYPPTLDDDVIASMRTSGFRTLNLSLGSTDALQQKRFGRPNLSAAFDHALEAARKHQLTAVGYLIAGAPHQKALSVVEDLLYLASRRVLAALSIFYPAPGSSDFNWCRRNGALPEDIARWRATAFPLGDQAARLESATLLRLTRILNFMKRCMDHDGTLPVPASVRSDRVPHVADRNANGRYLLRGFLFDGKIRGIDPQGRIFVHQSTAHLTRAFREGLDKIDLQGTV
jgi:radical SAM superfamily enzyme YgiQ (UPF0313 family)